MTPAFGQALLGAEAPPARANRLAALPDVPTLLADPALTEGERRRARAALEAPYEAVLANGARLLSGDARPRALVAEEHAPPAIYVRGDLAAFDAPAIAIVGTRNASTYGKACAMKFAEAFARAGVTVVSGGALGIDAAAHRGALGVAGRTVAVLATGIEGVYPAVHDRLFADVAERGALVSQFAVGTRPDQHRFLIRNGLIAMLADAVVVIEAPARSGAIRTANDAADLGREVYVVPANIDQVSFAGSLGLLRDGATIAVRPQDVLDALGVEPPAPVATPEAEGAAGLILAALAEGPKATEALVAATGLSPSEILGELTILELDGRILRDGAVYGRM